MTAGLVENLRAFQQLVIVDVQNARRHFRPLEHAAGLHKMPTLVASERGIANAVKTVPAALNGIAEARKALVLVAQFGDLMVKAVDVFPQFAGDAVRSEERRVGKE